ncbi:MAG: glycine betaine ABC transporter substrate-binding protein, partial [Burkholderiales bacterium]
MGTRRLSAVQPTVQPLVSFFVVLCFTLSPCGVYGEETLKVGSKRFTESYILGEIVAQVAHGEHRPGLGNTAILVEALRNRAVDVYPEYSGTIAHEILRSDTRLTLAGLNARLE